MKNKPLSFKNILGQIKESILTKWIGCFIALVAVVLSIVQAIAYSGVAEQDFNVNAVIFSILGVVLFILLSLFRKTSPLAPVALMTCDFIALCAFISKIVDFFSTEFFDGFSFAKLMNLSFSYSFSTISFVVAMVVSCIAVYVPQNRKIKQKTAACGTEEEGSNEKA